VNFIIPFLMFSGKPDETDNRTLKDGVYKGKLVIIINERTISRGETTAMSLKNTPGSVVLGRPSAGANGDVRRFTLPGKLIDYDKRVWHILPG